MTFFLWVAITALSLAIVVQAFSSVYLAKLRRSGRYPERGTATMADVVRLFNNGSPGLQCVVIVKFMRIAFGKQAMPCTRFRRNNSPRNAMRNGLKTIVLGSALLGQAFLADTAGAVCLDPKTFVSD